MLTPSQVNSPYILDEPMAINGLLARVKTIAVVGIRGEAYADRPAHYVPRALHQWGLTVLPLPIPFSPLPILGLPCYESLQAIDCRIDVVNFFRRPDAIAAQLPDILAVRPLAVWMQLGISHPDVAATLAEAGIYVVQNRCLMVDYAAFIGQPGD